MTLTGKNNLNSAGKKKASSIHLSLIVHFIYIYHSCPDDYIIEHSGVAGLIGSGKVSLRFLCIGGES